jgi:hypothetical protein
MAISITFDNNDNTKKFILSAFNKTVDENNFIIENDTKEKVLTQNGEEIQLNEFAGLKKGSEIYIKSDLPSLFELAESL